MSSDGRIFDRQRASHLIETRVLVEHCVLCGALASHLIAEQVSVPSTTPISALCCEHFRWIVEECSARSYELPTQRR